MKKLNINNLLRILTFIMFTFYVTFNGVHIKIGGLKIWINGLIDVYKSSK